MDTKLVCWDCKEELKEGDEYMTYNNVGIIKCRKCHEKDPILRNFQETEVYSRVCGYIRPLRQWNPGKKSEHKDKKYYKNGQKS